MIRLGSISFINSLPVDLGLASGAVHAPCEVNFGIPRDLNSKLLNNELDVSPISALHYAQNNESLVLLPDLSISSHSGVKSVLLFSRVPITQLEHKTIWMSPQGKTTPGLLQILLSRKFGVEAQLVTKEFHYEEMDSAEASAFLVIGDDALMAYDRWKNMQVTDLAEEWKEWTGLPFVFAVWAARRDFYDANKIECLDLVAALQESKVWGAEHMEDIIEMSHDKIFVSKDTLKSYFKELRYDLEPDTRAGLSKFIQLATEEKLIQHSDVSVPKVSQRLAKSGSEEKIWPDKLEM